MAWKHRFKTQIPLYLFLLSFFVLLYFLGKSLPNGSSDNCVCPTTKQQLCKGKFEDEVANQQISQSNNHRLAVIVPFRDRFEELMEFVPHMHQFLLNQSVLHEIFIVNQKDDFRFNRASLINAGFLHAISLEKFDYIAMHDVDLLPVNPELKYVNPGDGFALHIASPKLHPKYHYDKFVGGILILTVKDFEKLNGLSNKYWGWGLEDDEFYLRMKQGDIVLLRPENITKKENYTSMIAKDAHIHDSKRRVRDQLKCYDQKTATRKRDRVTGLKDVSYQMHSISSLLIDSSPATLLNVLLHCNKTLTPWCREIDEVINSDWANSAKMELSELNQLERQFLQAIDWFLFVDDRDFADALARVEFRVAQRESLKRGWLTYTDLDVLARQKLLTDTWDVVYDLVINVSIACVTAYLASLVTLVGSAIVVSSLPWNNVGDISPSQSTPSQPMITPFVTTTSMPPNNNSSDLHPEDINFMDFEADSELSEISFHHSALDSDAFLKDFTAVTLGTFSHLPRPPYLKANETLVGSFVDSISYLQQSYCSLIDSVIRFRSNSFTQMPLCAIIA
nr:EOG090X0AZ6 [Simocephalus serrulatus]